MSRKVFCSGLLIAFLLPVCAPGQSLQRVPIPERTAVPPIIECAKLVQHDFSSVADAPTRIQSAAIEAATAEQAALGERLRRADNPV